MSPSIRGKNFSNTPAGARAARRIIERGEAYWKANIYHYYRSHTGRLGSACSIRLVGDQFVVAMRPLIDPVTGMNYGRAIRNGISAGEGAYNPYWGVRGHSGEFPGVSVTKFWRPWMRDFQTAFRQIVREETQLATRQLIKQTVQRRSR